MTSDMSSHGSIDLFKAALEGMMQIDVSHKEKMMRKKKKKKI